MGANREDVIDILRTRAGLVGRMGEEAAASIAAIADDMVTALRAGGTLYSCGNGGSAAQSAHFAAELVGRFKMDRPALAAASLTENVPVITSVANDYDFGAIFERQVEALGRNGDCLLALSTSGRSENVVRACKRARAMGIKVFALTGESGGEVGDNSDVVIKVPSGDTPLIQEMHLVIIHVLCQLVESAVAAPHSLGRLKS